MGRRADAQRNYERLLAAADAAFGEHGVDTSLERIARTAGVAIGTLYSHFPSRRALVGALLRDRHDALFEHGEQLLGHPTPGEALADWARAVVVHAAAYSGLARLLAGSLDDEASELHAACKRMTEIGDQLVANARAAGVIRPDVTGTDVFTLISAAAWAREEVSPDQADRLLTLTLDGLRARP